jgi:hypothetical protein
MRKKGEVEEEEVEEVEEEEEEEVEEEEEEEANLEGTPNFPPVAKISSRLVGSVVLRCIVFVLRIRIVMRMRANATRPDVTSWSSL